MSRAFTKGVCNWIPSKPPRTLSDQPLLSRRLHGFEDTDIPSLLKTLDPKARDKLRRVLVHDLGHWPKGTF